MDSKELAHRFAYHKPSSEEVGDRHSYIRRELGALAEDLNELLPDGREKSTAITRLEEAMFWANAAIARHQ